jgi:hypothetical protein
MGNAVVFIILLTGLTGMALGLYFALRTAKLI